MFALILLFFFQLGVGTNDESLLIIDPMQEFKEVAKIKTGKWHIRLVDEFDSRYFLSGLVKKMYFSPRETYLVSILCLKNNTCMNENKTKMF